jgi:hypothetical protein
MHESRRKTTPGRDRTYRGHLKALGFIAVSSNIHGDPPIGVKIGDDIGEIDLDLTLEKYNVKKSALKMSTLPLANTRQHKHLELPKSAARDSGCVLTPIDEAHLLRHASSDRGGNPGTKSDTKASKYTRSFIPVA